MYAEPRRLGYVSVHEEPGKTKRRKVYSLTAKGRRALREWMSQPASFRRIQNEAAVRLMCADIAGPKRVLDSLRGMRPGIPRVLDDVATMERNAQALPHRRRTWR